MRNSHRRFLICHHSDLFLLRNKSLCEKSAHQCDFSHYLSAPFFNSVFMALIQTKVEPEYLGRVLGLTGAIMTLASPLGLGLTALFADATDVPLWFLLAGVITLTCGGLMLLLPSVRTCGRP